ncbi:MAG: hypothetical protein QM731_07190 [Chitinophagaceae bacterium]
MKQTIIILLACCSCFLGFISFTAGVGADNSGQRASQMVNFQVIFRLNKTDHTYRFIFFNKGSDTVYVLKPKLSGGYSEFRLWGADSMSRENRCLKVKTQKRVTWVRVLPQQKTEVTGEVSLDKYFCKIEADDLLSYMYQGMFSFSEGVTHARRWGFTIDPVKITAVDSTVVESVLF